MKLLDKTVKKGGRWKVEGGKTRESVPRSLDRGNSTDRPRKLPVVLHTRVVTGTGGGPEKTILNSPRFLKSAGYRLVCAYMHPPGDPGMRKLQARAEQWDAELVGIEDRGSWDLRVVSDMLRLCRQNKVAIWHGHDYKSNALGLLLKRFWPMHLVTTVHGWVKHTARTPLYYYIDRLCLPRYEQVLCVSPDLQEAARDCGVPEDRCILIENAIDVEEYRRRRSPQEVKPQYNIPPERIVIGAVGRLSDEKGFDLLIRAVHQLLNKGLDLQLHIVGEGDARPGLESLISELGRGDRVQLLGFRSDMLPLYESMDVFALSSLREGLPNVVLEAMALEVPVVSTRVAGVPRVITDGVNGLLVECGSAEALAIQLERLVRSADVRQQLSRNARETIESKYSFQVRMEKIRAIYDRLLGRV